MLSLRYTLFLSSFYINALIDAFLDNNCNNISNNAVLFWVFSFILTSPSKFSALYRCSWTQLSGFNQVICFLQLCNVRISLPLKTKGLRKSWFKEIKKTPNLQEVQRVLSLGDKVLSNVYYIADTLFFLASHLFIKRENIMAGQKSRELVLKCAVMSDGDSPSLLPLWSCSKGVRAGWKPKPSVQSAWMVVVLAVGNPYEEHALTQRVWFL